MASIDKRNRQVGETSEVYLKVSELAVVTQTTNLIDVIKLMNDRKLGIAHIVDGESKLVAVFTDGDIRRALSSLQKPLTAFYASDIAELVGRNPISVKADASLSEVFSLMLNSKIWDCPILSSDRNLIGSVHFSRLANYII